MRDHVRCLFSILVLVLLMPMTLTAQEDKPGLQQDKQPAGFARIARKGANCRYLSCSPCGKKERSEITLPGFRSGMIGVVEAEVVRKALSHTKQLP